MQGTLALAFLFSVAAGCMGPGPVVTTAGVELPDIEPAHQVVLREASATIEVPLLLGPASDDMEWTIAEADVPDGVRNVGFEFTRSGEGGASLEDRCRVLRDGGAVLAESRFSGGETYGLAKAVDTCAIRVWDLEPGVYTAVYVLEEVGPAADHSVQLRVVADLEPWRPAQW